jgi:type II secretory pathway pseudopilin PulG
MKKNFTLMEIVIAVVIVGILAVVGVAVYDKMIEDAKARVCETNTDTILGALEIYVLENDQLPGSISQLTPQQLQRSYARLMQRQDAWKAKLAIWLVGIDKGGSAVAAVRADNLKNSGIIKDLNIFDCPASHGEGVSYEISDEARQNASNAKSFATYNDEDSPIISDNAPRHKTGFVVNVQYYKVGVNKKWTMYSGGITKKKKKPGR